MTNLKQEKLQKWIRSLEARPEIRIGSDIKTISYTSRQITIYAYKKMPNKAYEVAPLFSATTKIGVDDEFQYIQGSLGEKIGGDLKYTIRALAYLWYVEKEFDSYKDGKNFVDSLVFASAKNKDESRGVVTSIRAPNVLTPVSLKEMADLVALGKVLVPREKEQITYAFSKESRFAMTAFLQSFYKAREEKSFRHGDDYQWIEYNGERISNITETPRRVLKTLHEAYISGGDPEVAISDLIGGGKWNDIFQGSSKRIVELKIVGKVGSYLRLFPEAKTNKKSSKRAS